MKMEKIVFTVTNTALPRLKVSIQFESVNFIIKKDEDFPLFWLYLKPEDELINWYDTYDKAVKGATDYWLDNFH